MVKTMARYVTEAYRDWRAGPPHSSRDARGKVQSNSLLNFKCDIYSQRGDDGIIREVCRRLGLTRGFFIEFGGWDGVHLSNTRLLFEKGWAGMFIEGDPAKAVKLRQNYRGYSDVKCIQAFVCSRPSQQGKTLDKICDEHGVSHIDFLSIDIDGLDLNIFESLQRRPTLVAIEGGFSWHPQLRSRVPDEIAAKNVQQPLHVAVETAKAKGYTPICFNQNLYIVDDKFAGHFSEIQNDAVTLWLDAYYDQTQSFRDQLTRLRRTNTFIRLTEAPYREELKLSL